MAGAAQADRARPDASGSSPGYRQLGNQPVCRHPDRRAVAQGGYQPDQHARRRGDRACCRSFRARPNGGLIVTARGRQISIAI